MITTQEYILMHILDCGNADLDLLNKIEYDLCDIIDYLKEIDNLKINSIFRVCLKTFEILKIML